MLTEQKSHFILLSTQRTGSSWVIDRLSQMANSHIYGELFLPQPRVWEVGATDYPRFVEATQLAPLVRPFSTFAYLNQLYARPGTVGFKVMYSQLKTFPELLPYFLWRRTRVIHLVRRNHLDVVISNELARAQGLWHQVKEGEEGRRKAGGTATKEPAKPGLTQIELNPQTLIHQLTWLEKKNRLMQQSLAWSGLPFMEVAYEELVAAPDTFRRLWTFLGMNWQETLPQSTLTKIRQTSYCETIKNYPEVAKVLVHSKFANLLSPATHP